MRFFLDTNVPIAFTVIHDKYHEKADDFIYNHQDNIFWSNLVLSEYDYALKEIMLQIDSFFDVVEDSLKINQKDFINQDDFENFLLKKTITCELDIVKKQKIIEYFGIKIISLKEFQH